MKSQYVATLDLDPRRLVADLDAGTRLHYSEAYSDFLIGGPWKSCMLFSPDGIDGDGFITNYLRGRPSGFSESGRRLPYLREVVESVADLDRLLFVRLAVMTESVIMPHRDYLELADVPEETRAAHRVHIALATNEECYFSTDNTVYRMRRGEVWFFDASRIHSVASFTRAPRVHLVLDFTDLPGDSPLLRVGDGTTDGGIPPRSVVARPPLSPREREALMALAPALNGDTYHDVFSMVIKKHFRFDGGPDFAWDTMAALAEACPDPAVRERVADKRHFFELERSGTGAALG